VTNSYKQATVGRLIGSMYIGPLLVLWDSPLAAGVRRVI
jgi:hypothetical protein